MKFKIGQITKAEDLPHYDLIINIQEDFYTIFYMDNDGGQKTEEDDTFYDDDTILITDIFHEI